jgi:hypothetical protein
VTLTAPAGYTINAGSNDISLSANHTLAGETSLTGKSILVGASGNSFSVSGNFTANASYDIVENASILYTNTSSGSLNYTATNNIFINNKT